MNSRRDEFTPYWLQTAMPSTENAEMPGQAVMFPWEYPWPHTAPRDMWAQSTQPTPSAALPPAFLPEALMADDARRVAADRLKRGMQRTIPTAPPPSSWDTSVPSWWQSTMPLGANIGYPETPAQPVDESWTDRWAGRTGTTAWPEPPKLPEKSFADRVQGELGESAKRPVIAREDGRSSTPLWFTLARELYDAARFPFDLADGAYDYRPETPGVWTEEDEFRKNDLRRRLIERSFDFAGIGATASVPTMLGAKAPRSTLGVFVGPFGAERLTQGGLHPAVNPAKALTDLEAQAILKARQQAGDLGDGDVFSRSAWFRGADGVVKKEIPDTGATLVPTGRVTPRGEEFIWQHPAGDIHQAYNIPPITIGRGVERDFGPGATTVLDTGRIYIAVDPRKPGELAKANRVAAEEIQHAIQAKERIRGWRTPRARGPLSRILEGIK